MPERASPTTRYGPPGRGKTYLAKAAGRIVPFYEAWGQPEKAAEWRAKLAPSESRAQTPTP